MNCAHLCIENVIDTSIVIIFNCHFQFPGDMIDTEYELTHRQHHDLILQALPAVWQSPRHHYRYRMIHRPFKSNIEDN